MYSHSRDQVAIVPLLSVRAKEFIPRSDVSGDTNATISERSGNNSKFHNKSPYFLTTTQRQQEYTNDDDDEVQLKSIEDTETVNSFDNASAGKKVKKTKEQRSAPRKRRPKKSFGTSNIENNIDAPASQVVNHSNRSQFLIHELSPHERFHRGLGDPYLRTSSENKFKLPSEQVDEFDFDIQESDVAYWFDEVKKRRKAKLAKGSKKSINTMGNGQFDSKFLLDLRQDWLATDQIDQSLFDADYLAEEEERKKWSEWALCAAEIERKRRIQLLSEIDAEQDRERQARRRWAIRAIEQEKHERISAQFLSNLTSTNWFNETITAYHEDYELVCPYYKLGCRVSCRRSNVEIHMKTCRFALELGDVPSTLPDNGYEVVCPNSVLGCNYIGGYKDLQHHLSSECTYKGLTKQQEIEERLLMKQHVIMECEEERARRVRFDGRL